MAYPSSLKTRLLRSSFSCFAAGLVACGAQGSDTGNNLNPANGGAANSGGSSALAQGGTGAGSGANAPSGSGGVALTSSSGASGAPAGLSGGSINATGGASNSAGADSGIGGSVSAGGGVSAGGAVSAGGSVSAGGTSTGGSVSAGGTSAGGGTGGTAAGAGVCDIFASGNTPCVAAHSTVRALYRAYSGNLYQVTRADQTTKDIGVVSGGFADAAAQDAFCAGSTCKISIIYDQSGKNNHLKQAPPGQRKATPDNEADAAGLKLTLSGHAVYGVHLPPGYGYRIDQTTGVATGDQPETEYMVTSGTFFNGNCCWDYGNAETNNRDDGAGTMEAVYFGNYTHQGKGGGNGPWVMADMENGVFAGPSFAANPMVTPLTTAYVTAMVIGRSGSFALRGGNAQTGALTTMYDGKRANGYDPMKKQGAIILGIGGDNTAGGQGNFYEGVLTAGAAADATTNAVQANIVAAGYGM